MLTPTDPPRLRIRKNPLLKPPTKLSEPHRLQQKIAKHEFLHALEVANAARELGQLPERDHMLHCVMRGNFHGWDLVPAILRLAAQPIESLYLATLGFNQRNAAEMLRLIDDGQIGALTLVCANYMRDASAETFQTLANGLRERGQRIAAARNHAKVIAAKLPDGRAFIVESSANLRSCHNIEQFTLTESPALFDFHVWWMERVVQIAANEETEAPKPKREAKIGRSQKRAGLGVWACTTHEDNRHRAMEWKKSKPPNKETTARYADALAELIKAWSPNIPPKACLTTPPQGASAPGLYYAEVLGRETAKRLKLPYRKLIERTAPKTSHHPQQALRAPPFKLTAKPPPFVVVVDDLLTSGATMKASLAALTQAGAMAFGFAYAGC